VRVNGRARRLQLATRRFDLAGGITAAISIRMGSRSRRVVKKLRRVAILATVRARDQAGNARTVRRSLRLLSA
jgi:hypothetical protein